jgi:hypothetical protein
VVDISNIDEPDSVRMTVMLQSATIKVGVAFITSWATSATSTIGGSRFVLSILHSKQGATEQAPFSISVLSNSGGSLSVDHLMVQNIRAEVRTHLD